MTRPKAVLKRQDARNAKTLEEPGKELDQPVSEVLAAAIEVHRILGPGFLESVYEHALCVELGSRNLPVSEAFADHPETLASWRPGA